MSVLRGYIYDVLTELRKDDEFIRRLKAIKSHTIVPITNIESMVDEWANTQRGLRPAERRLAYRLAVDKFPELYEKAHRDEAMAKKSLHVLLNKLVAK